MTDEQLAFNLFQAAKQLADAIEAAQAAGLHVSPPANGYILTSEDSSKKFKYVAMSDLKNANLWSIMRDVGNSVLISMSPEHGKVCSTDNGRTWDFRT